MGSTSISSFFGDFTGCLAIIGALSATYVSTKLLLSLWRGVRSYFLAKPLGLSKNLKNTGQWAVVTGATDGIGKAYAQQLAELGMDVCLVSRNPEKLADVASEIEKSSSVKTKCIAVDFTGGQEVYDKLRAELKDMDIGVLVNNVGMSYSLPSFYGELDDALVRRMINMNCNSVAQTTSIVLPGMAERKRGAIISVSSASALKSCGSPMLTLYAATKAFVDTFSRALQAEYARKGITVQVVLPFFVATKMSKIRRATFLIPNPTTYVRQALATVGLETRTMGCVAHALEGYVVSRVPDCVLQHITLKQMLSVRKRALKKQAQHKTQ